MSRKLYCTFVFFLFAIPFARATDYYLSPLGDDNDTGASPEHALQSIQKLNTLVFSPGDHVFFQGGETYRGTLYLDSRIQGDARLPIQISSYGEQRAVLIPNDNEDGILIHDAIGIEISQLILRGEKDDENKSIANGIHICSYDKNLATAFVHLHDIEISGFGGIDSSDASFGDGVLIDNKTQGGIVNDILLERMSIHDNEQTGIRTLSHNRERHQNIKILNSETFRNPGNPNSRGNSGSGINLGYVSNATVEGCKSYENGSLNRANGGPVGIWAWLSDHVTFRGNESFHNKTASSTDGGGFDFDGGVTDSLMENNLSWENAGAGFLLCGLNALGATERVIVRNNRSINDGRANAYAGLFIYNHVSNSLFENNQIMMYATPTRANPVVRVKFWSGTQMRFSGNTYEAGPGVQALIIEGSQGIPEGLSPKADGSFDGIAPAVLRR